MPAHDVAVSVNNGSRLIQVPEGRYFKMFGNIHIVLGRLPICPRARIFDSVSQSRDIPLRLT
jgi:hypothetical protein